MQFSHMTGDSHCYETGIINSLLVPKKHSWWDFQS